MLTPYHEAITRKALTGIFAPDALDEVVYANLRQDDLRGQIGHDEFHFDNSAFKKGYAYIKEQREQASWCLTTGDASSARAAFGRLIHTVQDFYAHSNYVDLWLESVGENPPLPTQIDPHVSELLDSPCLHSGKLYYPLEFLAFVPFLKKYIIPLLPRDSHAHMNLDSPERGIRFAYAFEAAVKRTRMEVDNTTTDFFEEATARFLGYRDSWDTK